MKKNDDMEKNGDSVCCVNEDDTVLVTEGYVVRAYFANEDYSVMDALKNYIKHVARLKY